MHFRRLTAVWALLAIMFGQVALVQHNATHIDHGFSQDIVASHDDHHYHHDEHHHDHDDDNEPHECSECFLINSLQIAFYNAPVTLLIHVTEEILTSPKQFDVIFTPRDKAHAPRAPPVILI